MIVRKPAVLLATLLLTLGWAFDAFAQGQFDSKPVDLPWKIAFIRDRNLWIMEGSGANQREILHLQNITGRLTWAPDGKRIAFTRQGEFEYQLPDGGGGHHRMYDIFAKHIDSTRENSWWWVTSNHGSHSPEWSKDGEYIIYVRDVNGNLIDAELPDYQIHYQNWDASKVFNVTRKGAGPRESMGLQPTWSPDRTRLAFIYIKDKVPVGLVVEPTSGIKRSEEELEAAAKLLPNCFGPAWSPDGKWIAYVDTQDHDNGIYLVSTSDMTKKQIFNASGAVPHRAPLSWSPDSKWLTFSSAEGNIYIIGADGKNLTRVSSGGNDYYPAFSTK